MTREEFTKKIRQKDPYFTVSTFHGSYDVNYNARRKNSLDKIEVDEVDENDIDFYTRRLD